MAHRSKITTSKYLQMHICFLGELNPINTVVFPPYPARLVKLHIHVQTQVQNYTRTGKTLVMYFHGKTLAGCLVWW